MNSKRPNYDTCRILAAGELMRNDTWSTGLNNNDLIIGPSGAGKTRGYVKPNLMQCTGSFAVSDTKGALVREVGPLLERRGYQVVSIDFSDMAGSCGYNPLDYIRRDPQTGKYSQQDIMTVSTCMVPVEDERQPFWDFAARMYLTTLIAYTLECLPREEHTLEYVAALFAEMPSGNFDRLMAKLGEQNPDSFAYRKYKMHMGISTAEKMHESIRGILAEKLDPLVYDEPLAMYRKPGRLDFKSLGQRETAVFFTVSDTDRSSDKLASLFFTQALQSLCHSADRDYPDRRLPVPVRLILDDFATNLYIPDFDRIISVLRSREIYASVILQSLSQLESLYGEARTRTIVNNCDNCLYLGGQDVDTAKYISFKANRTVDTILSLPLEDAYLFTRGRPPKKVRKYDIRAHTAYPELPEAEREGVEL